MSGLPDPVLCDGTKKPPGEPCRFTLLHHIDLWPDGEGHLVLWLYLPIGVPGTECNDAWGGTSYPIEREARLMTDDQLHQIIREAIPRLEATIPTQHAEDHARGVCSDQDLADRMEDFQALIAGLRWALTRPIRREFSQPLPWEQSAEEGEHEQAR